MIEISVGYWAIPSIITAVCVLAALCVDDGGGHFSGIGKIFALVPALLVSTAAWMIYSFFK